MNMLYFRLNFIRLWTLILVYSCAGFGADFPPSNSNSPSSSISSLKTGEVILGSSPEGLASQVPLLSLSAEELKIAIARSIPRVEEFAFIQNEASRLGVRVYLFGGTAAAFAHYVKWDLLRQKGDTRFFPHRFDYSYINIYRSTQDLDIVVDGPMTAIESLQKSLSTHFPYLQGSKGSKSSWEVRSLGESHGTKIALLNNPDFLNQHTDSQSVGMIELTGKTNAHSIVRDLRDWNQSQNPQFLRDVLEGKIHYYFSKDHETTKFFKEGRNPPIVSVIRYFIKVFQLDLRVRSEDESVLRQIINDFDPTAIQNNAYLKTWFENNAPKLLQNAIDVEEAVKTLDRFGLRDKLRLVSSEQSQHSIAWWMDKQPLFSYPLDQMEVRGNVRPQNIKAPSGIPGAGLTAGELGLVEVAHETTSYLIYEAITRSHKGLPNVFISRQGKVGEAAAFGDGFYVMRGHRSGFRGTGFTIRFKVHPKAREGIDFSMVPQNDYILIHNRASLEVIPEHMQLNLVGYYSMLASSDEISKDDLGIFYRLQLSLRAHFAEPDQQEREFLANLDKSDLFSLMRKDNTPDGFLFLLGELQKRGLGEAESIEVFEVFDKLLLSLGGPQTVKTENPVSNQTRNILRQIAHELFVNKKDLNSVLSLLRKVNLEFIRTDLISWCLDRHWFSNANDAKTTMEYLIPRRGMNPEDIAARSKLENKITTVFLSFNPEMPQLSRYAGLALMNRDDRSRTLVAKNFRITSGVELMDLLMNCSSLIVRNQMIVENPHWLQKVNTQELIDETMRLLEFGSGAPLVLLRAQELYPKDSMFLLTLMRNGASGHVFRESIAYESVWESSISMAVRSGKLTPPILLELAPAVPSFEAYKQFIEAYLSQLKTLSDFYQIEKLNLDVIGLYSPVSRFSGRSTVLEINETLLIPRLASILRNEREKGHPALKFELYESILKLVKHSEALIEALRLMLDYGVEISEHESLAIIPEGLALVNPSLENRNQMVEKFQVFLYSNLDLLNDKRNRISIVAWRKVISELFGQNSAMANTYGQNDQDLTLVAFRHFILLAIRNIFTLNKSIDQNPIVLYRSLFYLDFRFSLSYELDRIKKELDPKYGKFIEEHGFDLIDWRPEPIAEQHWSVYASELDDKISESTRKMKEIMRTKPLLLQRIDHVLPTSKINRCGESLSFDQGG